MYLCICKRFYTPHGHCLHLLFWVILSRNTNFWICRTVFSRIFTNPKNTVSLADVMFDSISILTYMSALTFCLRSLYLPCLTLPTVIRWRYCVVILPCFGISSCTSMNQSQFLTQRHRLWLTAPCCEATIIDTLAQVPWGNQAALVSLSFCLLNPRKCGNLISFPFMKRLMFDGPPLTNYCSAALSIVHQWRHSLHACVRAFTFYAVFARNQWFMLIMTSSQRAAADYSSFRPASFVHQPCPDAALLNS